MQITFAKETSKDRMHPFFLTHLCLEITNGRRRTSHQNVRDFIKLWGNYQNAKSFIGTGHLV